MRLTRRLTGRHRMATARISWQGLFFLAVSAQCPARGHTNISIRSGALITMALWAAPLIIHIFIKTGQNILTHSHTQVCLDMRPLHSLCAAMSESCVDLRSYSCGSSQSLALLEAKWLCPHLCDDPCRIYKLPGLNFGIISHGSFCHRDLWQLPPISNSVVLDDIDWLPALREMWTHRMLKKKWSSLLNPDDIIVGRDHHADMGKETLPPANVKPWD